MNSSSTALAIPKRSRKLLVNHEKEDFGKNNDPLQN
jgi:hypothetical protein